MNALRRQSTYAIVLIAGPIVPIALSLAGLIAARTMGPSTYGRVAYFFSSFNLVVILGQLGLGPLATGEVARSLKTGGLAAAARVTPPYIITRIASLAVILTVSIGAALLGDGVVASAIAAAAIALLTIFVQALAQGLGLVALVAAVQIVQALLYLAIVVAWARVEPERIFATVALTYAVSFVTMAWASRALVPGLSTWRALSRGRWAEAARMIGWLYVIALMLTPFSSLAVLVLGNTGRFGDAAAFSIAFTIPQLLSVTAATIITIQYYPRLSHLLADADPEANKQFDTLNRLLLWMGFSVATVLLFQPTALIDVLFTAAYANAVSPLASMALAAVFLPVVQLGLWTLIAHRHWAWAMAVAATQLVVILPFISTALVNPSTPLWLVGAGHTVASAAALGVAILGLYRIGTSYDWRPRRMLGAAVAGVAVGWTTRLLVPVGSGPAAFVYLVLLGTAVACVTAVVIWTPELGGLLVHGRDVSTGTRLA